MPRGTPITDDEKDLIRRLLRAGDSPSVICARLNVSKSVVSRIAQSLVDQKKSGKSG